MRFAASVVCNSTGRVRRVNILAMIVLCVGHPSENIELSINVSTSRTEKLIVLGGGDG